MNFDRAIVCLTLVLGLPCFAQQDVLREAARLDASGKCQEAEQYYRKAFSQGSPSSALLNNAGNHYLICGQPQKARVLFEQLVAINPAHPGANLQLARLALEERQGSKALLHLDRVRDKSAAYSLLRAEALHWSGKHSEAATMLENLEREARADRVVLTSLGMTYARIGSYDRAETAFTNVLAITPNDPEALLQLGRAAARAQHYERAHQALEAALQLRPDGVQVLFELGLVNAARQDSARAVYLLAQARQKSPKRADILLALARAAEDAGFYGDSALAYDEYLQLRPGEDQVRRDRARIYGLTGSRLNEGLAELDWYVKKHPEDPHGFYYVAQLVWENEPKKALQTLSQALRLQPDFAPALLARGWLLSRLGDATAAVKDFEAAAKIKPGDVRVLDRLGTAYLALDRHADAERTLRQAHSIAPEDPDVLLHLGRALMAMDRPDEAQPLLDRYQRVRRPQVRAPLKDPGMLEAATLSQAELTRREITRLRRDAQLHPDQPELQFHLADLLLSDRRTGEALTAFKALLERNVDPGICERAAASLIRAGHSDLAAQFRHCAAATAKP